PQASSCCDVGTTATRCRGREPYRAHQPRAGRLSRPTSALPCEVTIAQAHERDGVEWFGDLIVRPGSCCSARSLRLHTDTPANRLFLMMAWMPPLAVHYLGDAKVHSDGHERNCLVLSQSLGGHREAAHLTECISEGQIDRGFFCRSPAAPRGRAPQDN